MAYPGGDPEAGRAYMQQWTGKEWICYVHKPEYDYEAEEVRCKQCYMLIMDKAKVRTTIFKHKGRMV